MERRKSYRHAIWFPLTIGDSRQKVWAVCRDASVGGVLIASSGAFEIGDTVTVSFRLAPNEPERTIEGHIVRIDSGVGDGSVPFPHRIAVEFTQPLPELEGQFLRASDRPPGP